MARLLRGLLLGLGLTLLFAPLRGQEMRRLIGERLRSLRTAFQQNILTQPAQPATNQLAQVVGALRGMAQPAATTRHATPEQTAPITRIEQNEAFAPPIVQNEPPPSIPSIEQSPLPPAPAIPPAEQSVASSPIEIPEAAQPTGFPTADSSEETDSTTKLPVLRPEDTASLATTDGTDTPEAASVARKSTENTDTYSIHEPDLDMTPIKSGTDESSVLPEENNTPAYASGVAESTPEAPAQSEPSASGDTQRITLNRVPGITPQLVEKLEAEEIHTIPQLLERTSNKEDRTELAQRIELGTNALRALVSRADLMQLPELDADTATLMQEANVTGCKDLQRRNPDNLLATLTDVQARKRLGGRIPSFDQLGLWIAKAAHVPGNGS